MRACTPVSGTARMRCFLGWHCQRAGKIQDIRGVKEAGFVEANFEHVGLDYLGKAGINDG